MKARGLLIRPVCGCGNKAVSAGLDKKGRQNYKTRCKTCIRRAQVLRKDYCEGCGKKWEGGKRFDTDHIDGNPSNNDPSNVQTLCRKCHSKKTTKEKHEKMSKMQRS
jgi:5-methylcytosine-specific restriction endonuclease McrA